MRLSILSSLLLVSSGIVASASPVSVPTNALEASLISSTVASQDAPKSTLITVPDLKDFTGKDFEESTKKGYWFIKHYSPYCSHCKKIAPTWQALYEYYMRSSPSSPSSPHPVSPPSFTDTYDFHFANVNCNIDGDLCADHKISAFPTFVLYKDGKDIAVFTGAKDMKGLTDFVETYLEKIKPGTRPATVDIQSPDVDAHKAPPPAAAAAPSVAAPPVVAPPVEAITTPPTVQQAATSTLAPIQTSNAGPAPLAPNDKIANEAKDSQKGPIPNPEGTVFAFDSSTFQKKVTTTRDGWFIKFYAPWCSHCQAMAPAWKVLGTEMKGELNIGEVNCEVEKRLCKEVKVHGYPTILFFKNGEKVDYDGLRGVGDLVSWARMAADSGVKEIGDAADFEALEKKHEVIFLYFYDHATTSEDFDALSRVTLPLIGHAPLYKTNSEHLARKFRITTWPRLIVVRDGRPLYYRALSPDDIRNPSRVITWMESVWLPIVPELTASNSHEIMNHKTVVLAILDRRRSDSFEVARKEVKAAAIEWTERRTQETKQERQDLRDSKQLRIEEATDRGDDRALRNAKNIRIQVPSKREVGFAWVDGVFWERWIKQTYGVEVQTMGERIIINDEDRKLYWDESRDGNPILPSRSAILEAVRDISRHNSAMKAKSTVGKIESVLRGVKDSGSDHPILTILFFIIAAVVAGFWWRGRNRRAQGYHHVGLGLSSPPNAGQGFWPMTQGWFGSEKGGFFGGGNGGGGKFD